MNTYEQTRKAYLQGNATVEPPKTLTVGDKTPLELASLGYAHEARAKDTRRTPARQPLQHVLGLIEEGKLPKELRSLAEAPPTKEDARYLHPEVQRLVDELAVLDKAIGSIPHVQKQVQTMRGQKDAWTSEAIRLGITDRKKPAGAFTYPHQLETAERSLAKIADERDSIIRGASAYVTNNMETIDQAGKRLTTLRQELQAPQPYHEAKAGIAPHRKTARAWLDDVSNKPSLDDRVMAQQVLEDAGMDHKAILHEAQTQGMSLIDKMVEQNRADNASPDADAQRQDAATTNG